MTRWTLSWEAHIEGMWVESSRDGGEDTDILDQHKTLVQWAESGEEPIRNVELTEIGSESWGIHVCPTCGEQSTTAWCVKGCRSEPWGGSEGGHDGKMATRCEYITVVRAPVGPEE